MEEEKKVIPEGKVSFVVRTKVHPNLEIEKQIYIDGELLDWSVDIRSYWEACRMGMKQAAQEDIARHFIETVSEVIGRRVTAQDIRVAEMVGYI